jgi:hypothetical protein
MTLARTVSGAAGADEADTGIAAFPGIAIGLETTAEAGEVRVSAAVLAASDGCIFNASGNSSWTILNSCSVLTAVGGVAVSLISGLRASSCVLLGIVAGALLVVVVALVEEEVRAADLDEGVLRVPQEGSCEAFNGT